MMFMRFLFYFNLSQRAQKSKVTIVDRRKGILGHNGDIL